MVRVLMLRREQDGFESDRPVYRTIDVEIPQAEAQLAEGWYVVGVELLTPAPARGTKEKP